MNDGNEKLLIYFKDEEHIVRRLGAAVVSCWNELPDSIRVKLVERSLRVFDEDETVRFDEHIRTFLKQHAGEV